MRKIEAIVDDQGKIEVVFNAGFGGFGISKEALDRMIELGSEAAKECLESHLKYPYTTKSFYPKVPRFDAILVQVVKELKNKASGESATLAIGKVNLDDLINIKEYDGKESIRNCYDYTIYGRYDEER
jgi:hypothetical protein